MDRWLLNGVPATSLPLEDRGLAYGDGLFETIAVRNGQCRFLDDHLDRLLFGCERLGIKKIERHSVVEAVSTMIDDAAHATLKIVVTRGSGERGYKVPDESQPSVLVGIEAAARTQAGESVVVRYCTTRIGRNPAFAGLKTLNRLEQVMARAEWDDPQIREGLMSDDRGHVICGTMTNLFYVAGGTVVTPLLQECGVQGIMRARVIAAANKLGIEVQEQPVTRNQLDSADEVFLSNSLIGIWPVAKLAGQSFTNRHIVPRIMQQLVADGVEECAT